MTVKGVIPIDVGNDKPNSKCRIIVVLGILFGFTINQTKHCFQIGKPTLIIIYGAFLIQLLALFSFQFELENQQLYEEMNSLMNEVK